MNSELSKIKKLQNLLLEETELMEDAVRLEKEKRHAIIGARSLLLDDLCKEQEILLSSLSDFEFEKNKLMESMAIENLHNLTELLTFSRKRSYNEQAKLEKICEAYRKLAGSLKKEVKENQELLVKTSQSIQRLLGGLQKEIKTESTPGYAPVNSTTRSMGKSMLINANA